jgi:hypothetical protein
MERVGVGEKIRVWYVTVYGWDGSAVGRAGFMTANHSVLEKKPLEGMFGRMIVVSDVQMM